jgi:hypothetical protein
MQTVRSGPFALSDIHNLGRGLRQSGQLGQRSSGQTHLVHRSHMLLDLLWLYGSYDQTTATCGQVIAT